MPPKSKRFDAKRKQLHRLLALLRKLDKRERVNAATLASEFNVSKRTALRDIKDLNESGFAVVFNEERRSYQFADPGYTLRGFDLNDNELMVLFLGSQMAHRLGKPLGDASLSLIRKAYKETGRKTEERAEKLREENRLWIDIELGEEFEEIEGQYNAISKAMDSKVELEITYVSMNSQEETRRVIAPYGLIVKYGLWYVIGYCKLRGEMRVFALDCIRSFRTTGRPYTIPADFRIEAHFEAGWSMIRYGEPVEVVLRFSKEYARWIKRRRWHPTQVIEEQADGSIIFRATVAGTMELKWWTYHWIPYCEILAPPELKREVMEEMKAMIKRYGE